MKKTQMLVFMGLLISMEIVLTRFLSFQTPFVRISLGFIPIALSAVLFGPLMGGITGMMADIIGMMIAPMGAYFPGFTISAFITGAIYGLLLYKKPKSIIRVSVAVLAITLIVHLGLNTIWLSMITGKAVTAFFVQRLIKSIVTVPLEISMIYVTCRYISNHIENSFIRRKKPI